MHVLCAFLLRIQQMLLKRTARKSVPKHYEFKKFVNDNEIIEISSNDDEEEPSIEEYYDHDDDESSFEVNKKVKVENSDPDYVPSEDAPATPEVNVPFAVKIKDEEEADKLFAKAMEILVAIWKFRQEKKK
ncbi:uncharacterized protein A4U43_UnF8750 [Asparagus officinalis]|uniref:Uncharacterized protein n=1 Tax=Asparagus officinalis TaxID=4686 RepID=A0A1R3L5W3_ASPOF|nr:uncharacterized protein A4U43_UnF8750 [Asparagus officinalis]